MPGENAHVEGDEATAAVPTSTEKRDATDPEIERIAELLGEDVLIVTRSDAETYARIHYEWVAMQRAMNGDPAPEQWAQLCGSERELLISAMAELLNRFEADMADAPLGDEDGAEYR